MTLDLDDRLKDLTAVYEAHVSARARYERFYQSLKDSLSADEAEQLLRSGTPGMARVLALDLAGSWPAEQRQRLLPEFLALASCAHGQTEAAQALILSLPRDWLEAHLPAALDTVLETGGYEQYAALHALCGRVSPALADAVARRGAAHGDARIAGLCRDQLADAADPSSPR